ncbi:MAG TPA: S41 family peptidase [Bacteroidales bacterium]|nr:S41 family peptidase [Bacteroidales bacterium]HRX97928.1 S41 family peptidase [Bacteroidales bacterium]
MKTKKRISTYVLTLIVLISFGIIPFSLNAQEAKIQQAEKQQVVDSIAKLMTNRYVFPDVGKDMGDLVLKNMASGKYDAVSDYNEFGMMLTDDLRSVSNDRHIGVRYNPERIAMEKKAEAEGNEEELEAYYRRFDEANNYNFKTIKILPGNVGYLKFNGFANAAEAGPTAVAALNFLAYTDALIIDLTENGGGSPSLIQLMTTYFFDEPEHLNSFYIREGDQTEQFWTLPWVPGRKMTNTDIYILTSSRTFSGAEEFTYNLKKLERATIVGETTGGGAHPVSMFIINDNFTIGVPFGRAVNPITNTNWEGTGVEPDVKVNKDEAFDVAYQMALEKRLENEEMEELKNQVAWTLDGIKAKNEKFNLDPKKMKEYTGNFGPRVITLQDGALYYQREDRPKMKMIPMKEDVFYFDELQYFRLKFIRENGKIVAVEGMYDNGNTDKNEKG